MTRTVGLPMMHKEAGERRQFLPEFVDFLGRIGSERIVLEEGYGRALGLDPEVYRAASPKVHFGTYQECLSQQVVVVLRCPAEDALRRIPRGSALLSMLHYPTRPGRVRRLIERGIRAVSLDSVTDDRGRRLVENLEAVAWNGVREAFRELSRLMPGFDDPERRPLRATILGVGQVGGHASRASVAYGDPSLRQRLSTAGVPGVEVTAIDAELTGREDYLSEVLARTDLLIDATLRPDPGQVVVSNRLLGLLPGHAVVLDLAVDPYDFSTQPPGVKAVEGIVEGTLDQWAFGPVDPAFDLLPSQVPRTHRRTVLSCYSWPGIDPKPCMDIYGKQIEPVVRVLVEHSLSDLDERHGRYFERAVARAEVNRWRTRHAH